MSFNETSVADSILYYQNKSLKIALKINDSSFIASAYGNIGNAYLIQENHNKAIENYNKALAIFEEQKNRRAQGMIFGTFGNVYLAIEDYIQAIYYYEKSRTIFKDLNFTHGYTSSTINIGICKQRLKNYEEAILFLEEGKKLCEDNDFKRLLRVATLQIGSINFNHFKDYKKAKIQYEKTEELATLFEDKEGIGQSNLHLGNIASIYNQHTKAIGHYKKAILNFKQIGKKDAYSNSLSELISELKKSGKSLETLQYYDELITINDSIFNESSRAKSLELLTKFDVSQKNKELEIQNLNLKKQALEITKQRNIKIFFSVFSGLLIILLYFVWRANKYKKLNAHNEIKSKRIELEQRLLRSQMNPHFIFNALNSIQSYVSENNTMNSEIYLSRFSRLMRQILEHSQEEFILLKDDLNALESYLTLEQLRFENSFEYTINTNTIDQEIVMIPPMLLQPFVENAILHGLQSNTTKGIIKISFSINKELQQGKQYGTLNCTIEDNGIGRVAAAKKEVSPNGHHLSLAMKLIRDRLANYTQTTNKIYTSQIEDLYSQNKVSIGTKIHIETPYTQELE
jgi:tetratricopeptide (TPR) repeat protein